MSKANTDLRGLYRSVVTNRAGLGNCGARLEAFLRGPISVACAEIFEEGHQVIMVEIMSDVKERDLKG